MSPNYAKPYVLVLPEDKANSDLATGFHLGVDFSRQRQMQVLRPSRGWIDLLECFKADHVSRMRGNGNQLMVLLIDLDDREDRLTFAKAQIPSDLTERVFVLSAMSEPEALKAAGLGSYEIIGSKLANDCREETADTWSHDLLRHNASELERLIEYVRPILF